MERRVKEPQSGPTRQGQGVATGIKTSLVIIAASQAYAGDTVTARATIKNISSSDLYVAPAGVYDSTTLTFYPDYLLLIPGVSGDFYASFTMPNKSVRVQVWSFWWDGSKWVQDDYGYVDVALASAKPDFQGFAITEYDKV